MSELDELYCMLAKSLKSSGDTNTTRRSCHRPTREACKTGLSRLQRALTSAVPHCGCASVKQAEFFFCHELREEELVQVMSLSHSQSHRGQTAAKQRVLSRGGRRGGAVWQQTRGRRKSNQGGTRRREGLLVEEEQRVRTNMQSPSLLCTQITMLIPSSLLCEAQTGCLPILKPRAPRTLRMLHRQVVIIPRCPSDRG